MSPLSVLRRIRHGKSSVSGLCASLLCLKPPTINTAITEAQVDEEVTGETSFSNLYTQDTAISPVFRLPPEILEIIFIHGARDYYYTLSRYMYPLCVPSWVNVSYICRLWRSVAVNCSTLWSYHFAASLRWTEELLRRSKQAPLNLLDIRLQYIGPAWWSNFTKSLWDNAERIQELYLYLPCIRCPDELFSSTPNLRRLEVQEDMESDNQQIVVGDIPSLRTLNLVDCTLRHWSSVNLRGLTALVLRRDPSYSPMDITDFLVFLSGLEELTLLHVEDPLGYVPSSLSSQGLDALPKANLHCLTRLAVIIPRLALFAFLSCVIIPSQTTVWLGSDSGHIAFMDDDYTPLYSFLTQRFNTLCPTIRSLVIYRRPWAPVCTFSVSECNHDICDLWTFGPSKWELNIPLTLVVQENWSSMDHIINNMCPCMPSANVRSLHVLEPPLSLDFWKNTLWHLRGLRHIKLSYGRMPDLASLLSVSGSKPAEHQHGQTYDPDLTDGHMLVPDLEELELHFIQFATACSGVKHISTQKVFTDALATRRLRFSLNNCSERFVHSWDVGEASHWKPTRISLF